VLLVPLSMIVVTVLAGAFYIQPVWDTSACFTASLYAVMLVLDIQGAELDALRSGTLRDVDLLICEASWKPRYAEAVDRGQLEAYLEERGFRRQQAFQHGTHDIFDLLFERARP